MDLAIAGEGFFRYQQPNGEIGYSRNGQLTMTADGRLVNAQGAQIMGYPADAEGNVQEGGNVVPMEIPPGDLPANATTELGVSLNLNSGQPVIAAAFNADNANTYNYSTNATVFDSQGNARNLTLYFTKTAANQWNVNGRLSGGPADGGTYDVALGNLTFTQNGTLQAENTNNATFNNNEFGAGNPLAALDIELSFEGTTQFASESTVNDTIQDGYTAGALVGITIEEDGTIMRNYSNEESRAAGQVTLVTFRNPEGLRPEGDNLWAATGTSGQELLGAPGAGLRGLIQPNAIETSNVDMARELVDMIVAQRAYQANSQTISTQDELLQTIINI